MKKASEVFSLRASSYQDERSRLSLLPTAVKLTRGKVSGAALLLRDAPTQAVLGSAGGCRMENAGRIDEVVPAGKRDIHGDYGAFCYEKFRHSL